MADADGTLVRRSFTRTTSLLSAVFCFRVPTPGIELRAASPLSVPLFWFPCRLWSRPPTQVLRDWKLKASAPGVATEQEQDRALQQLESFFRTSEAKSAAEAQRSNGPDADRLISNKITVEGLDHMLQGLGLSLASFRNQFSAKALLAGESRYSVTEAEWPEGFQKLQRKRRACIAHTPSGARRIESPWVPESRRSLHLCLDRGPCSWPMVFWMYCRQGVSGTIQAGPNHLIWGSVKHAMQSSGFWSTFLEVSLVCSVKVVGL